MQPKLSIVITARNDNYGGNLVNRVNTSIKVICSLAEENKKLCEIVLVEYNPVENKKFLFEEMDFEKTKYCQLRAIIVPKEFHDKFSANKIPLLEYVAKNIGIRRAKGEYILVMNPDIILSREIFNYINSEKINTSSFYRADRRDISISFFSKSLKADDILKLSKIYTTKILKSNYILYVSYWEWIKRLIHSRNINTLLSIPFMNKFKKEKKEIIHEHAAGDFLLTHYKNWGKTGGYDETPLSSFMDSYILHEFIINGLKQEVINHAIYHIDHEIGKIGRPEVSVIKYNSDVKLMTETGRSYRTQNSNWGYPSQFFVEK